MKNIKYLILSLIIGFLWLTSFSSAESWSCLNQFSLDVSEPSYLVPTNLSCSTSNCQFLFFWSPDTLIFTYYKDTNSFNQIILSWNYWWLQNWENGLNPFSVCDFDIVPIDTPTCPTCPTCEDCSTCQGSLWACLEENTSIENMNSSLQDQLSQCLANSNACDPTEDEDCYTWAYQLFHLFRQNQGSDFSLPITNNIFLPSWLRAFNDSWSVALAPLSPSDYSLDRESWEILNDLVIKIFYYLAVLLSVMALAYYIKKFLSFTLFPKKD